MQTQNGQSAAANANNNSGTVIHRITVPDLWVALRQGQDDYFTKPTHGIFIVVIYALIAIFTVRIGLGESLLPIVLPVITGFSLLGPLVAAGLYELSRRRETGLDYSWWHVFDVARAPSRGAILAMGLILAVLFVAWLYTAMALYDAYFGATVPAGFAALLGQLFTTATGWQLLIVGSLIGFLYSVVVFMITVVSLPMMLHHEVNLFRAIAVSVRAVLQNWRAMAVWYLTVAALFVLGSLPLFIGLVLVLPILAHATWHLYRKLVTQAP